MTKCLFSFFCVCVHIYLHYSFLAHLSTECSVSYCDHLPSVSVRPSVRLPSVRPQFLLKVALQILGRKFYKNTKKSSLYSQSLLIFIHRTPVVERHPRAREIRFTTAYVDTNGKHGLFLHEQLIHLHTENTQTKLQT